MLGGIKKLLSRLLSYVTQDDYHVLYVRAHYHKPLRTTYNER